MTIRPDGTDLTRVTDSLVNDAHVVGLYDGHILWSSGMYGFRDVSAQYDNTFQPYGQVMVMDADGSNKHARLCLTCFHWYLEKSDEAESSVTTTTVSPPSTASGAPTPPAETHEGQPSDCNKWDVVEHGGTCDSISAAAAISTAQFFMWNPAVSEDFLTNF
ncbi:tat pathway signal sequence domain-containing protein [Ilyonectria robusta]